MRRYFIYFFAFGISVIIAGFIYDTTFSGLPYQDPTPEMQQQWLHHKHIATMIVNSGIVIVAIGVCWALFTLLRKRLASRKH